MHLSIFLLAPLLTLVASQAKPDGVIVPFTSGLPACASLCGPLFDVQGACAPPAISAVSQSCFCADPRLQPFLNSGTTGVSSVCGAASCQDTPSLEQIQSWYETYCNLKNSNPTTTSAAAGATGTGSSGATSSSSPKKAVNQTWFQSHWKWVVMLIVLVIAIAGGWAIAACLRRRYLRKKEREIEMRSPVAWGPHQMQAATAGYNYGDGVVDAGSAKEAKMAAQATPADRTGGKGKKGWLTKERT